MVTKLEKPTRGNLVKLLDMAVIERQSMEVAKYSEATNKRKADYEKAREEALRRYGLIRSFNILQAKFKKFTGVAMVSLNQYIKLDQESEVGAWINSVMGDELVQPQYVNGKYVFPAIIAEAATIRTRLMTEDLSVEEAMALIESFRTGKV